MAKYKLRLTTPLIDSSEFKSFLERITKEAKDIPSGDFLSLLRDYSHLPSPFYDFYLNKKGKSLLDPLDTANIDYIESWLDNSVLKGYLIFPDTFEELKDLAIKDKKKIKIDIPDEEPLLGEMSTKRVAFTKWNYYFKRDK